MAWRMTSPSEFALRRSSSFNAKPPSTRPVFSSSNMWLSWPRPTRKSSTDSPRTNFNFLTSSGVVTFVLSAWAFT